MNSINLIGYLGNDWDVKFTQAGKQFSKNSIAIKKYDKSTFWVPLTAFGKTAEILSNHTQKGQQIGITGELDIREHEGKYYTSVTVSKFSFCGPKPDQGVNPNYSSGHTQNNNPNQTPKDDPLSDLPF